MKAVLGAFLIGLLSNCVRGGNSKEGSVEGVRVLHIDTGQGSNKAEACSSSAVILVDFDRIDTRYCFGCLEAPYCGKRMLKLQLKLSSANRIYWLFNIGDSVSNNGYGGDGTHLMYDAETQVLFPNISVYPARNVQPSEEWMMHTA